MTVNRIIATLLSVTTATGCLVLWGIAAGAAFDQPIMRSEKVVYWLSTYLSGYEAWEPVRGWLRFYVAILAFMIPIGPLLLLAALKGLLLPRNVSVAYALDMEMARAHLNTWLLWSDLGRNFKQR